MRELVVMTTLSHHPFHGRMKTKPQHEAELREKIKGKHPEDGTVRRLLGQLYLQRSWLRKRQCCGSPGGCHGCSQVTWSEALIHQSVRSCQPEILKNHTNKIMCIDFTNRQFNSNIIGGKIVSPLPKAS